MAERKFWGMDVYKAAFAVFWFAGTLFLGMGVAPNLVSFLSNSDLDLLKLVGIYLIAVSIGVFMLHKESFK